MVCTYDILVEPAKKYSIYLTYSNIPAANAISVLGLSIYADYEKDTAQTIEQIDSNNIVYEQLCQ